MKTKNLFGMLMATFLAVAGLTACNSDDDSCLSESEVKQALSEMKGTYTCNVDVSFYQGNRITKVTDVAVSSDNALLVKLPLEAMADGITDEVIARRLRNAGAITVKAGYDFHSRQDGTVSFGLFPEEVTDVSDYDVPTTIRIVFSQNYGGDADTDQRWMVFNLSPVELWIGEEKYADFKPMVFHFESV